MKSLIAGAALLCALSLPTAAHAAPASPLPGIVCVPYQPSASRFLVRGEILKALPLGAER